MPDLGLDITSYGPQEPPSCPLDPEECGGGLRQSCGGCDFWDEEGEWIHDTPKQ
jgi:hypothetical protein